MHHGGVRRRWRSWRTPFHFGGAQSSRPYLLKIDFNVPSALVTHFEYPCPMRVGYRFWPHTTSGRPV